MAAINVGQTITTQRYANADNTSLSYHVNAYLFYVDVTLNSQNTTDATSNITITHRMKCVKSYYSQYRGLYGTIGIGDEVKATKYLPTTASQQTYTLGNWTGNVAHDANGELQLVIKGIWHGYDNNNNYGPVSNTLLNTVELPTILRTSKIAVTPATLRYGNATINVTRYVTSYTTTIKYKVNGTTYTLATKSTATTFYLAYTTIKNLIGSFTSAIVEITAETYNGNTLVGTDSKSIIVQTGKMPASLYDDKQGNVGIWFGEEAKGPGARFKMPAYFDDAVYGIPIPDPPTFTQAWAGKCVNSGSTITCNVPANSMGVLLRWYVGGYYSTLFIPRNMLTTSYTKYIVSDESYYAGGEVRLSETTFSYRHTAQSNTNCYLDRVFC